MRLHATLRPADWLWLLGSLCRLSRVPFDAQLVAQQFPPPHNLLTLREAAHALGFTTGEQLLAAVDPSTLAYPCIALLKEDASGGDTGDVALDSSIKRPHLHLVEPATDTARSTEAQPALL